ncbi:MAG TPA: ATP-binding protein [Steroidobacteraceae bacterium]|nr:ATP-binding protein [Steroidobacteraceae bacterium]
MIKVQSLRNRIILQFLIILVPLAAVLVILTLFDLQRASALENSLRLRELSLEAKDAYARFIEGVIDAMDTGTLSKARADALDVVAKALNAQRRIDPKHDLDATIRVLGQISQSVRQDPSLPSLLRLQPVSNQVSRALDANRLYYQQRHERSIAQAIEGANRQNWIVLTATLLSVVFAVVFVRGMIRGLTRPLAQATDVANRIAGGEIVAPDAVRTEQDIGGLLHSLARMNTSLHEYRHQVEEQERALESKIAERTQELGHSVERLQALSEVSQAVNSTLDLQEVLETIVARAVQLSSANAGAIYELDETTRDLRLRASSGLASDLVELLRAKPVLMGEGAAGLAAATHAPVSIADIRNRQDPYPSLLRDVLDQAGLRAVLALPLLREGRVFGALALARISTGRFRVEIVDLLQTVAEQSTLAIQNARLFREIEQKGRELESASQHKSQFLANMSHELRTPLNAILGYTELIIDRIYGEVPETIRDVLERVQKSGRHLLDLINDVLDLSKIEAGQLALALTDYSFRDMVHTVISAMESLAAEKGLKLTVEVDMDLPVALGDERRIAQVLMNLLGNAIKFTETGELKVAATRADTAFLVSVADTGPGIAESDQQRIFEEFQQVDSSSTRAKGGTGLGLAITKRIVEMHGGRLWVESVLGEGSKFYFSIPVRTERQEDMP